MAKKITNYLTEGLPSHIYLLCYIKPRSGYKLAKKIYGTPTAARIYNWTSKMVEKKYLEQDRKKKVFTARIEPLINEIKKHIHTKDSDFTDQETRLLQKLLESSKFKDIFESYFSREKHFHALSLTCLSLSMFAGISLVVLKKSGKDFGRRPTIAELLSKPGDLPETAVLDSRILPKLKEVLKKVEEKRVHVGSNRFRSVSNDDLQKIVDSRLGVFFNLPDSFLEKLVILSEVGIAMTDSLSLGLAIADLGPEIKDAIKGITKQ